MRFVDGRICSIRAWIDVGLSVNTPRRLPTCHTYSWLLQSHGIDGYFLGGHGKIRHSIHELVEITRAVGIFLALPTKADEDRSISDPEKLITISPPSIAYCKKCETKDTDSGGFE